MRILSKYRLEASGEGVFAIKDVKDLSTKYLVQKMGERGNKRKDEMLRELKKRAKTDPIAKGFINEHNKKQRAFDKEMKELDKRIDRRKQDEEFKERERQFDEDLKDQLRNMRKNNPAAYKRLMQQYGL